MLQLNTGKKVFISLLLLCVALSGLHRSAAAQQPGELSYQKTSEGVPVARSSFNDWVSANIPLDSWVYPALDKLSGFGLIDSALQGSRPYTRMEATRQTLEAKRNAKRQDAPPVVFQLIRKLTTELHQQMVEIGALEGIPAGSYIKPLGDWDIRYIYKDGKDSVYAPYDPQRSHSRIDASQYSLNYNNFGIEYEDNSNAQLIAESEARLGKRLLVNLRPVLLYRDDPQSGDHSTLDLLEGTAVLGLGPLEFSIGRQSLWWGQGRHGSLVLTNNADPLEMVRLTNPSPALLPWFFKYLGPFRFDLFLSELEESRVVPEPYFGGLRLEFKPLPWLSLGGCRTVMFGGDGRPSVDFSDFMTIIGGKNLSGDDDTSNSIAALDARLRIPALWGLELYGEMGGEDEGSGFISNKAYIGGAYLPQIEPSGRASLRVEYADLSHLDNNSPVWYRHGIYQSGYTYRKKIMGHHVGGGAEDIFVEMEILLPHDLSVKLGYDYEKRGADQPVYEKHRQSSIDLRWDFSPGISLNAGWKHDSVENFEYISGQDEDFYLTELAVGGRF